MKHEALQINDRVRVKMSQDAVGKVLRIGATTATVEVESERGPLIINSPLGAIEKVNGKKP